MDVIFVPPNMLSNINSIL